MNGPENPSRRSSFQLLWGEFMESFQMAMAALAAHKLRAALTLTGVIVGVFSIIVVMTAMRVLQNNVETELSQLGVNAFAIQRHPEMQFEGPMGWEKYRRRKPLTLEQVLALRERATMAQSVGAETGVFWGEAMSEYARTNPDVRMEAVTPEVFAAKNWTVAGGRALMEADMESARNICVLGSHLAKTLFPHSSATGETIKMGGVSYTVVGTLQARSSMGGEGQDNFMAVPLTTGLNRYAHPWRSLTILVQARSQAAFDDTIEQVRGVLRTLRKVAPGDEDDFEIMSNDSLIEQFRNITFAVRIGVAVISSIALLAAGVGIMNIMLVTVTERTREIGVRRAIGAKKRNILAQFIIEAVVICEVGGLIGVALGVAGGNAAAYFLKVTPIIPVDWVLFGLLICSAVGLIFGTYPAIKAANLDPIESLRYE
jgi:putative ABC transport system permease protein